MFETKPCFHYGAPVVRLHVDIVLLFISNPMPPTWACNLVDAWTGGLELDIKCSTQCFTPRAWWTAGTQLSHTIHWHPEIVCLTTQSLCAGCYWIPLVHVQQILCLHAVQSGDYFALEVVCPCVAPSDCKWPVLSFLKWNELFQQFVDPLSRYIRVQIKDIWCMWVDPTNIWAKNKSL